VAAVPAAAASWLRADREVLTPLDAAREDQEGSRSRRRRRRLGLSRLRPTGTREERLGSPSTSASRSILDAAANSPSREK
jgi:hypothetical protein